VAAQATRIAGAPISWGINEVEGWGHQMDAARVLEEAASLGLPALESGPEGFLSKDPVEASRMLEGCETGLCLDTGHLVVGGDDPVRVAELAAGRVRVVHLKDADRLLADLVAVGKVGFEDAVSQGVFK